MERVQELEEELSMVCLELKKSKGANKQMNEVNTLTAWYMYNYAMSGHRGVASFQGWIYYIEVYVYWD